MADSDNPIYLKPGFDSIPTAAELVIARHNYLVARVRAAEEQLGKTLTTWQFEVALAYLTIYDFADSGRGAGKTFLADFLIDSGLCEEDAVRG